MKLEDKMYLWIQFGKPYKKQVWMLDLIFTAKEVAHNFNISKTEVKRLIQQKGIQVGIIRI